MNPLFFMTNIILNYFKELGIRRMAAVLRNHFIIVNFSVNFFF